MTLDRTTALTLRSCSIETFIEFVNKQQQLATLHLLGGLILGDVENYNFKDNWIGHLLTEEEKEIRLRIIQKRIDYLVW